MQLQTDQPVDDDTALAELYQCYAQILLGFIQRYVSTRETKVFSHNKTRVLRTSALDTPVLSLEEN